MLTHCIQLFQHRRDQIADAFLESARGIHGSSCYSLCFDMDRNFSDRLHATEMGDHESFDIDLRVVDAESVISCSNQMT